MRLRLRLIDDAHWVIHNAWSMRLLILAAVLSGFESVLSLVSDTQSVIPRPLFAGLMFAMTVAAFLTRIIAQRDPVPVAAALPAAAEPPSANDMGLVASAAVEAPK